MYRLVHDVSTLGDFGEAADRRPQVAFNLLCLTYFGLRVLFLVWVSDAVIEEAGRTGRILMRTASSVQMTRELKECVSVGLISNRIGLKKLELFRAFPDRVIFAEYLAKRQTDDGLRHVHSGPEFSIWCEFGNK